MQRGTTCQNQVCLHESPAPGLKGVPFPQLSFNKVHNWRTKPSRCLPWTSTGRVPRRVTRVTPYLFSSLAWSHSVSCGRIGSKALVPEPLRWSPGRPLVVPWWSPGGPLVVPWWSPVPWHPRWTRLGDRS